MEHKNFNILRVIAHSVSAEKELSEFISLSQTQDYLFYLGGTYPVPDKINLVPNTDCELGEMTLGNLQENRITSESSWKEKFWGDSIFEDPVIRAQGNNYFCVTFNSMSNAPIKWLEKVSRDYPLLLFKLANGDQVNPNDVCDAFNGNLIQYKNKVNWGA